MQISQNLLENFKEMMKKKGRTYKSDDEARIEAQSLVNYVEFVYEFSKKDLRRKNKLNISGSFKQLFVKKAIILLKDK